jgi:hypothetical protein
MRRLALLLAAAAALSAGPASAGTRHELPVIVDQAGGFAQGALSTAREANSLQWLSCTLSASGPLSCFARDQAGTSGSCRLDPTSPLYPAFARNARSLNSASFFALYWDPATGVCTDMRLLNGSDLLANHPGANSAFQVTEVKPVEGRASAALTSARYSSNANEFLSCEIWAASGAIRCYARAENGTTITCASAESANAGFAEAVRSINQMSSVFLHFSAGVCTSISVRKTSNQLP